MTASRQTVSASDLAHWQRVADGLEPPRNEADLAYCRTAMLYEAIRKQPPTKEAWLDSLADLGVGIDEERRLVRLDATS